MTSLPISSNKLQPSGNAANASPTSIAADSLAIDARFAEPFAFLLARQIGESGLPALTAAQTAIVMDGNAADKGADPALTDAQNPAAVAVDIPSDPANTLAAIMLQLPALEDRGDRQAAQSFAIGSYRKAEDAQAMQPFAPGFSLGSAQETGRKRPMADSADSQTTPLAAIGHLPPEAVKRAELLPGLVQPAQNTAQDIASPAMPAPMPGMLTGNLQPAVTPQTAAVPQTVTTPLGSNGWADEFSQKISWISTQQNQVAELHLNPPNLGPLDVVLKISDNQATLLFTSPHAAVRDAVENALPKLRETLADNGIMLGNTMISDQPPRDRGAEGFANQGSGSAAQREVSDAAPETAGLSLPAAPARRHNGMVDTFA